MSGLVFLLVLFFSRMAAAVSAAPPAVLAQAGSSMMIASDVPPNQTLYLNNLNEKIKKGPLKKALYAVFSQFGPVMDVVCMRTNRLRGQAWVVFENVADSTNALRQMQGFPFFDKAMVSSLYQGGGSCHCVQFPLTSPVHSQRIQFAKDKSDAVSKSDGTYKPRAKRALEDADGDADLQSSKKAAAVGSGSAEPVMIPAPPRPEHIPPNNVLLASNIPNEFDVDALKSLFSEYPGFTDLRPVAGRGMAFVEFTTSVAATPALQGLHNYKLSDTQYMSLSYAKK